MAQIRFLILNHHNLEITRLTLFEARDFLLLIENYLTIIKLIYIFELDLNLLIFSHVFS